MSKIALGMICGSAPGEEKELDRALKSIIPHVDAAYITLTGKDDPDDEKGLYLYTRILSLLQEK